MISILIILYVVCTILAYMQMRILFSKGGLFYGVKIDFSYVFWTFVPLFNIAPAIYTIRYYMNIKIPSLGLDLNKFYRIKDDD